MRELESVSSTTQAPEDTSTDTDSKTNSDDSDDIDLSLAGSDDSDDTLSLAACTGWTKLSSTSISGSGLYCQGGDVFYRCNSDTRTGILVTSCRDNFDRKLAPAVIPTGAPIRQLAPAVIPTGAPIRQLAPAVIPTRAPRALRGDTDRELTSIPTGAPMRELDADVQAPIIV